MELFAFVHDDCTEHDTFHIVAGQSVTLEICLGLDVEIDCGDSLIDIRALTVAGAEGAPRTTAQCEAEDTKPLFENFPCRQVVDHSNTTLYQR